LIACSECGHEVSTAAQACPHCGNPIRQPATVSQPAEYFAPPPPMSQDNVRHLSFGLSGTVAGFWWASAAFYALSAFFMFVTWAVWTGLKDGSTSISDMIEVDAGAFGSSILASTWMWVTGILFIVWFFQAYRAAESRGAIGTKWSGGWAIGAWFIPFANLVIPKLVMNEVDRMSNPLAGAPPIEQQWKQMRRLVISDLWWILMVLGWAIWLIGFYTYESEPTYTASAVGLAYLIIALSLAVNAAAAAFAGGLVFTLGKRMRRP
ncbi:MAG: DUF4328 domain-containing protein, partial [Actinomycetota bacterium]